MASPRLLAAAARKGTEQQARYKRALDTLADMRARGKIRVTVTVHDLEALLAIAAHNDAALRA